MNKLKKLLLVALLLLMIIPVSVFAEGETTTTNEDSKKVTIYLFRGEGCSHCAEFEAWIKEIEPEYGSKFVLKDYEVWNDSKNAELMQKVADSRGEEAEGVPYILIGDHSWNGFADSYKTEMLEKINSLYETEPSKRHDVMNYLNNYSTTKEKDDNKESIIAVVIIVIVVVFVIIGIAQARKKVDVVEEVIEEEEIEDDEDDTNISTKKKTTKSKKK